MNNYIKSIQLKGLGQWLSTCILQWATEHFGLKKSYLHDDIVRKLAESCGEWRVDLFFFLEITCFRPEKPFQSNSRLMKIWVKFKQYLERRAMENFQSENGPRVEKGWEPLV